MAKKLWSILSKKHLAYFAVAMLIIMAGPYISFYLPWNRSISPSGSTDKDLLITEVIRQVREELYNAQVAWNETGENAMFEIDYFDLELSFVLKKSAQAGAKSELQLMAVSSSSQIDTERIQRIKLHMIALPPQRISLKAFSSESNPDTTTKKDVEVISRRKE